MALPADRPYWQDLPGPPVRGARLVRPIVAGAIRAAWRVRIHRPELVPRWGPVILAANHTGFLDAPLLYAVVRRPVHVLAKQEMFTGGLGRLLRWGGQIPLDRLGYDPAAVKSSLAVLHHGGVLAVYPEGSRGVGDFARIKPGVAYFALCTGAPIVPVASLGVREAARPTGSLPRLRGTIDVVFGEPISTTPVGWPRHRELVRHRAELIVDQLRAHVRQACVLTGRDLPQPTRSDRV